MRFGDDLSSVGASGSAVETSGAVGDVRDIMNSTVAEGVSRRRRKRVARYYEGTFYGTPSSHLVYELCAQANKDRNDMLWLAIVGVTDMYQQDRIGKDAYNMLVADLGVAVSTKNADDARGRSGGDGSVLAVSGTCGHVRPEKEYRFLLYRHWSLYESMYNSNYVASKLGAWRESGRHRLEQFLAKVGIPKAQYTQKFPFMANRMKKRLYAQMAEHAPEWDLPDVFYDSFSLQHGYSAAISAADFACAVTALLESGGDDAMYAEAHAAARAAEAGGVRGGTGAGMAGAGSGAGAGAGASSSLIGVDTGSSTWEENFTTAYDCLSRNNSELLKKGVMRAMMLQRSIVRQGTSMLEKKSITNAGPFRYVYMQNLSGVDALLFTQPLALAKLGRFIIDAHRERGFWKGKHARPVILAALNESRGVYLVVGTPCERDRGVVGKQTFYSAFTAAAQRISAHFTMESFESFVMEIEKQEIQQFIEALHEFLSSREAAALEA